MISLALGPTKQAVFALLRLSAFSLIVGFWSGELFDLVFELKVLGRWLFSDAGFDLLSLEFCENECELLEPT